MFSEQKNNFQNSIMDCYLRFDTMNSGERPLSFQLFIFVMENLLIYRSLFQVFICSLLKYTEYIITVRCFTSQGDGPKTAPVIMRTQEDGKVIWALLREHSAASNQVQ